MKKLDWKQIGQFLSVLLDVFRVIRDTLKPMKIGIEFVGWLSDEGKDIFVEKYLKPLGKEFLATQRIRVISETIIRVNLDAPLKLPFDGAQIEFQIGSGWVKVEKRGDGLYVDGRKVILHQSKRQKDGNIIQGHELREELSGKPVLHPNIMDVLLEYPSFIPEDWKKDENGNTRFIFFWAVIFRRAGGDLYVRGFYWDDGRWYRDYDWLDRGWRDLSPAALLAST